MYSHLDKSFTNFIYVSSICLYRMSDLTIFSAEIKKGKKVDEDSLGSRVFGVLDILDKALLKKFILEIFPGVQEKQLGGLEIKFWELLEGSGFKREPDIIISNKDNSILIFIELKKDISLDINQLYEEFMIGKDKCNDFYLACITDNILEPSEIKEVQNKPGVDFDRIKWKSWRWVNTFFKGNISRLSEDKELPKKVIQSLYGLLEHLGYGEFMGLTKEELEKLKTMIGLKDVHMKFLKEVELFCDTLEEYLESGSGIKWVERLKEKISRDGTSLDWDHKKWISTYFWVGWVDKKWGYDDFNFDESSHLYTVFWIDRDEIYVGYYGEIEEIDLENIEEKIANELKHISDKHFIYIYNSLDEWRNGLLDKSKRDNPENCSFKNIPENADKFEIYYRIKIDEFDRENREILIKKVNDMLCALRDMANKLSRRWTKPISGES